MSRRLGVLIAIVALTSGALLVSAFLAVPQISPAMSIVRPPSNETIWLGVLFWIGLTMASASLAVRLPGGSSLGVDFAPIVAAMSLGGPVVAGLVALFGVTQSRELRRQVPWYGVLANRAGITGPAVVSAYALNMAPFRSNVIGDLAATVGAAVLLFSLNVLVTQAIV
jgi:hypothetical protein